MTVKNGFHGVQSDADRPVRRETIGADQDDPSGHIKPAIQITL